MKKLLIAAAFILAITACKGNDPENTQNYFAVSKDSLEFVIEGGTDTFTISTNYKKWEIVSNDDWITTSSTSGTSQKELIAVTVSAHSVKEVRSGTIKISAENSTDTLYVKIKQLTKSSNGTDYPDYNDSIAPDMTGMGSNAIDLAKNIYAGWNLGNSLESTGGENAWGNPTVTQALIDSVKAAGFNAVRIPCAWNSHLESAATCKIKASWLARVKEVVDYCYNNDMYVILNIHWDGGWLENNPTYDMQSAVNSKQKALWEQIAVYFRDYDEHLLFAGTNEVHKDYSSPTTENIKVQQSYLQTFVNAVRSTGGKNTYRNLIVQSYNTNIDYAKNYLTIPSDPTSNRMFVEVHYYDPWDFCGQETDGIALWGDPYKTFGTESTWGQEDYMDAQFAKMKAKFVDNGYPVILGEYGVIRRSNLTGDALTHHLDSRAYYLQYITESAKNHGMLPFVWDNGTTDNYGFGIISRTDNSTFDKKALQAILTGAKNGIYPFQ